MNGGVLEVVVVDSHEVLTGVGLAAIGTANWVLIGTC